MQSTAAFCIGLMCGASIFVLFLTASERDEYDHTAAFLPKNLSASPLWTLFDNGMKYLPDRETIRPYADLMRYLMPLNQSIDEVSLFYRVDVETERQHSIDGSPTNYLHDYKNPCWNATLPHHFPYSTNRYKDTREVYPGGNTYVVSETFNEISGVYRDRVLAGKSWRLRCLPYVYLVGVTKSGTSDLYEKIIQHPDIVPGALKEPMWWNRLTIGRDKYLKTIPSPLGDYIDLYDKAAETIRKSVSFDANGTSYHAKVTIDGTPAYLWDYDGWQMIPGNLGLDEPRYTLAHTLKALVPSAKVIAVLRNPIDRLYSQFRMKWGLATVNQFHSSVSVAIKRMRACLATRTLRSCTYDISITPDEYSRGKDGNGHVFLRASMYYVYVADWLSVFSRDQMLIIQAEDYYSNRTAQLAHIFEFLDLQSLSHKQFETIEQSGITNTREMLGTRSEEPMLQKTRALLARFYAPYNKKLAQLLGDERYLWK